MEEYRDNGARLGWLIDPEERSVHVYRPGRAVETLDDPLTPPTPHATSATASSSTITPPASFRVR